MKLIVLSLATGPYGSFVEDWIQGIRKHLCVLDRQVQVTPVVLTDAGNRQAVHQMLSTNAARPAVYVPFQPSLEISPPLCVDACLNSSVSIEHEPWPYVTLHRYVSLKRFLDSSVKTEEDKSETYAMYLDIDMQVCTPVHFYEIFDSQRPLVAVQHPGYTGGKQGDYEMRPESCSHIANRDTSFPYVQGCLWGGTYTEFLRLIEQCDEWQKKDEASGIVPCWHDESYLNRYMHDHKDQVRVLSPSFCWPASKKPAYPCKIRHEHKSFSEFPRFRGTGVGSGI